MTVTETGGHPQDAAGDAERAWDAAINANTLDGYAMKETGLPPNARATYDKYAAKFGGAYAWGGIPSVDGKSTYFAVGGAVEEISWVDIYDASDTFAVHGANGDGGWQMSFWGFPAQPWDPSQQ
jgi:hypothetical protein